MEGVSVPLPAHNLHLTRTLFPSDNIEVGVMGIFPAAECKPAAWGRAKLTTMKMNESECFRGVSNIFSVMRY